MTPDEVAVVADACARVDGGCKFCAADLACALDRGMPWVGWHEAIATASPHEPWTAEELRDLAPCSRRVPAGDVPI